MKAAPLLCIGVVLLASHSHFVIGQMCSAPSRNNPMDPDQRGTSSLNTLYLYIDPFNSSGSPCAGELVQFDVCYQYSQNSGQPFTVFQLLLLEDQGTSYLIVASFEEQEDRGCVLNNSLCCKPLLPDTTVTVGANYAIMIIIPGATANNNLLAVSTQSYGYVTFVPINLATTTGGTILKSQLWLPDTPMLIEDRSLRAVIRHLPEETVGPTPPTEETPTATPTDTETTTDPPSPPGGLSDAVIIAIAVGTLVGGVAVAGVSVLIVLTVISCARKNSNGGIDMRAETYYDYPLQAENSIEYNTAYVTTINSEHNEVTTTIHTGFNEAYATTVGTDHNEEFASTTDPMYDYII